MNIFSRKLLNAARMARVEGFGAVVATIWRQVLVKLKLFRSRSKTSIDMDGCRFDLRSIPNTPMKLKMLQGDYEEFERFAAQKYVDTSLPVVELGGCIGVVACVTNRLLQHPTQHIVVEANPMVLSLLEQSRHDNGCEFEIVHGAIAYGTESITFTPERDLWANSLSSKAGLSTVTVATTSLRKILAEHKFDSYTLICDIEGHEYDLIMNEASALEHAETIVMETHERIIGAEKITRMLSKLHELGFRMVDERSFIVVMKKETNPAQKSMFQT